MHNRVNLRLIVEQAKAPVLVDAGVGTASDATVAMELGCDGVLTNTAIELAKDPICVATAMRHSPAARPISPAVCLGGSMPIRHRRSGIDLGGYSRAGSSVVALAGVLVRADLKPTRTRP